MTYLCSKYICHDILDHIFEYHLHDSMRYTSKVFFDATIKTYMKNNVALGGFSWSKTPLHLLSDAWSDDIYTNSILLKKCLGKAIIPKIISDIISSSNIECLVIAAAAFEKPNKLLEKIPHNKNLSNHCLATIITRMDTTNHQKNLANLAGTVIERQNAKSQICPYIMSIIKEIDPLILIEKQAKSDNGNTKYTPYIKKLFEHSDITNLFDALLKNDGIGLSIIFRYLTECSIDEFNVIINSGLVDFHEESFTRMLCTTKSTIIDAKMYVTYLFSKYGPEYIVNLIGKYPFISLMVDIPELLGDHLLSDSVKQCSLDSCVHIRPFIIQKMAKDVIDHDYLLHCDCYHEIIRHHPVFASVELYSQIFNNLPNANSPSFNFYKYANSLKETIPDQSPPSYEEIIQKILEYDIEISVSGNNPFMSRDKSIIVHNVYISKYYPRPASPGVLRIVLNHADNRILRNVYYYALKNLHIPDMEIIVRYCKRRTYAAFCDLEDIEKKAIKDVGRCGLDRLQHLLYIIRKYSL